jgi:uncharacterized membrane protein YbhN (UPF0104 family)
MASGLKRLTQSKLLSLSGKVALTLAGFWFVLHGLDFARLGDILQRQDHAMLLAVAGLMLFQMGMGAVRWRMIVLSLANAGRAMPMIEALRIYYISMFFTTCLPGTVGSDVVRVWLSKSDRVTTALAIHSVIIDRMVALAGLCILMIATLPLLGGNMALVLPLAAAASGVGLWFLFRVDAWLAPVRHFRLVHWLLYFAGSLRMIVVRPVTLATALCMTVAAHGFYCFSAFVLACSLGVEISFLQCLTLIPPVVLAMMLPVSIGGWGVREAGFVGMLAIAGVSQASALMLSIELGLLSVLITLPAGVLWVVYRKKASSSPV